MQTTKNYNLNKPDINDAVDITKLNENADKIDAELKKVSETIPAGLENAVIATDEMPTDPLPREADKLGGHEASYFATVEQLNSVSTAKLDKTGGTLTGILTAQSNTSYTVRQTRNIILSTASADVNTMQDGDIWIKYV